MAMHDAIGRGESADGKRQYSDSLSGVGGGGEGRKKQGIDDGHAQGAENAKYGRRTGGFRSFAREKANLTGGQANQCTA